MELTPEQQAAVDAPASKHVVIEACAGGGKTSVVSERIRVLMDRDGVDPAQIVVATFSKSQADDMAQRIFQRYPQWKETPLGTGFNGTGQILTLHALARRMVVSYYPEWARKQVAPGYKERRIIEDLVETLHWEIKQEPVGWESILWWINKFKSSVDPTANENLYRFDRPTILSWAESKLGREAQNFASVAVAYQSALDRAGMWTFADMLRVCEEQLTNDPAFRDQYRKQFTHILVDEGQDTAAQCVRIVSKLDPQSLFIVGDGDQELYGFLGATPEINLRSGFDKRYGENGLRFWMTKNFRSQPKILDRANLLIHNNYGNGNDRYKKTIEVGRNLEGPDLTWAWYADAREEAQFVTGEIADRIQQGKLSPGQVMIMGRLNAQNANIEVELLRRKLPFVNLGNASFFDQGIARIVVAYMSIAFDPSDWEAFSAIYNIASSGMTNKQGEYCPTRWLGNEFLDKVRGSKDLLAASFEHQEDKDARGWARWSNGVRDLRFTVQQIRNYSLEDRAVALIGTLRNLVLDAWIDDQYGIESDASSNVRDDLAVIQEMAGNFTVGEFLDYARQLQKLQSVKPEELIGYILVGTVYRFKGLERDAVWVIGLSDGLLPHAFATGDAIPRTDGLPVENTTTIESERNVAFVAVTRARIECHCSGVHKWPGAKSGLVPSRFVEEMGILPDDFEIEDEEEFDEETGYKFDPIGAEEYE